MSAKTAGKLTLTLEGDHIPLEKFRQAVISFLDLIEAVSKEATGEGEKLKWNISVASGSAVVCATPEPTKVTKPAAKVVLRAVPKGLGQLSKGVRSTPPLFSDSAMKAIRKLAAVRNMPGNGLTAILVKGGKGKNTIGQKLASVVEDLIGASYQSYGSIEGKLQAMFDRGGFKFSVFDALFDRKVDCFVNDNLVGPAINSFRHRVRVAGLVQYNKDGLPISIEVNEFYKFPPDSELPGVSEVRGIFKN